jgi:RNA polymerase sigma-70 factor (ECF subfamily)
MPVSQTAADLDVVSLLDPFRREVRAHCYRMTGCLHEAEDLVQETYLRAWRSFQDFEHRSSVRTWLYRIATNVCLNYLDQRRRRPLPTGLGAPATDAGHRPEEDASTRWLEPVPDTWLWTSEPPHPEERAISRESVRIAFIAALQHLTAQQRAVLLMRDVLALRAGEVAEALGLSVAGVNSTLQRAHARMGEAADLAIPTEPDTQQQRRLLAAYLRAFENYDVPAIVELLAADVVWEMPPFPGWYQGAAQVGTLIGTWCPARGIGDMRLAPTSANGLPAFAVYLREGAGLHRAFQLQQLHVGPNGIERVTAWFAPELFAAFGLPSTL